MSDQQSLSAVSATGKEIALKPNSTRAGIGGVGGGTGMVALAQAIGPKTAAGAILLYLAPAMSFMVGVVLYYFEAQTSRYLERRLVNNARKTLERQLNNPRMSEAYKIKIHRMLEELEESVATAEVARAKSVGIPYRQSD